MISALVLAAGQSKRMGRPKMTLAWGETTVLGRVIQVFRLAGIEDVLVVSGGDHAAVEEIARSARARVAFNPRYEEADMLGSLQTGLGAMPAAVQAVLIALGDQPQIEERTVRLLAQRYRERPAPLIVPSYGMRRGHPWLAGRELWQELLSMRPPETPRDFLRGHADDILYVELETPTILADLDTPDDYSQARSRER